MPFSLTNCKGGGGSGGNAPQNNGGGPTLTASAGWDRTVASGWAVTLDGSKSSSSSGGSLTYQWARLSGQTVTLSNATASKQTCTASVVDPVEEEVMFPLTVTDGSGQTSTSTARIAMAIRGSQ